MSVNAVLLCSTATRPNNKRYNVYDNIYFTIKRQWLLER